MSMINKASFEVNGAFSDHAAYGTVEVTLAGETRRVKAVFWAGGDITAYGISGRYRTSTKAWPGSITARAGWTNDHVRFGFDSRSGKHHKATISFA